MRTNKIQQNSPYQTSFQRRLVDSTVPPIIADAVNKAPNIQTIRKQYRIRLVNYNKNEDTFGRPVLHLFIKIPKGLKGLASSVFSFKPKEKVSYEQKYTAFDDKGIINQIQNLTVEDIIRIIKQVQDKETTARTGTPPEGVRTY